MGKKLWDVQSKASKTASAKGIGRELKTHEIRLLVLQRILNTAPLSKGILEPFMEVYFKPWREIIKEYDLTASTFQDWVKNIIPVALSK